MRVRTKQLIDSHGMAKDTLWNVSDELGTTLIANELAVEEPDAPASKAVLSHSVSTGENNVVLTAYPNITAPAGDVAQSRIASIEGTEILGGSPTDRGWAPYTRIWTLRRPAVGAQAGRVVIVCQCTGYETTETVIEVPAQTETKADTPKADKPSRRASTSQEA